MAKTVALWRGRAERGGKSWQGNDTRKGVANGNSECVGLPEREMAGRHSSGSWAEKTIVTNSKANGSHCLELSHLLPVLVL